MQIGSFSIKIIGVDWQEENGSRPERGSPLVDRSEGTERGQ